MIPLNSNAHRPLRLLKTTALRLAIRSVLLYAALLGLLLLTLRWSLDRFSDATTANTLRSELAAAVTKCPDGERHCLDTFFHSTTAQRLFVLLESERYAIGTLHEWPDEADIPLDGEIHHVWIDEEQLPRSLFTDDARLPVIAHRFPSGSKLLLAAVVKQQNELRDVVDFFLEGLPIAIVLSLAMGITIGSSILRRMDSISRTAHDIVTGDLSQRIPLSARSDEFDMLGAQLNQLLDRIQALLRQTREVTDNVAHDLRSPLTRMLSHFEVTLLEDRTKEEYREVLRRSVEDVTALVRIFQSLLDIAQMEAGSHRTAWGKVRLDRLLEDMEDLYRPVAEERHQQFIAGTWEPMEIEGSRDLLAEALSNLLENAIKFTPPSGTVRIELSETEQFIEITISDSGPGIPEADRERVFERFTRLEAARSTPGNGLGLSLVRAIASLHRADLLLESAAPGLIVRVRFSRDFARE